MFITVSDLITSKPFQRLKGKTQLFSPNSNDHYRNRMTHSFEVYAISLEIAKKINVPVDYELLSVIALSHDLGHTPFGHVGERTLNEILCGEDDLGKLLPIISENKNLKQGFKHNIYSAKLLLRTFPYYESNDDIGKVIDGIMKHTKPYYVDSNETPIVIDYGIGRIIREFSTLDSIDNYHLQRSSITLEGRIVSLADEIAQRCSDFSDAMVSKMIMFKDFQSAVSNYIQGDIKDYKTMEKHIRNTLVDGVLFDVNDNSVYLDATTKNMNDDIDLYIKDRIQKSYLIRTDDLKNCHMIRQVFKALYKKPSQLDDATLVNVYSDIYKSHVPPIKKACCSDDGTIDLVKLSKYVRDACVRVENKNNNAYDEIIFKNLMSNIAYYIADMTDSFLKKKYHKLYNGEND